jgi:hypothetical protein
MLCMIFNINILYEQSLGEYEQCRVWSGIFQPRHCSYSPKDFVFLAVETRLEYARSSLPTCAILQTLNCSWYVYPCDIPRKRYSNQSSCHSQNSSKPFFIHWLCFFFVFLIHWFYWLVVFILHGCIQFIRRCMSMFVFVFRGVSSWCLEVIDNSVMTTHRNSFRPWKFYFNLKNIVSSYHFFFYKKIISPFKF